MSHLCASEAVLGKFSRVRAPWSQGMAFTLDACQHFFYPYRVQISASNSVKTEQKFAVVNLGKIQITVWLHMNGHVSWRNNMLVCSEAETKLW